MQSRRLKKLFFILSVCCYSVFSGSKDDIRLNQIGFYTYGPKIATVVSPKAWYFSIKSTDLRKTFYTGELTPVKYWKPSGDSVKIADFSQFTVKGKYVLYITGTGASHKFTISDNHNYEVSKGLIRHFYYQRASTALPSKYAGKWARSAGHFDTKVIIHPSAASASRSAGQVFSSPKGWYDAGDYGKYIVNAGISTYQLLLLYEQFSSYFDTLLLNIPESANRIPDLLDEIKWELDWVLTMQDPSDGGVYHKLTGKTFIGDLAPSDADEERYFIGKSVTAAFDFAAICAVAYRIYNKYYPSFADSCLQAAKLAYKWGVNNPKALFRSNPEDVKTGQYEDANPRDEWQWAAYELFIATEKTEYRDTAIVKNSSFGIPGWQSVGMLGLYSMALVKSDSFAVSKIISTANSLIKTINKSSFLTSIEDFYWGSNGLAANEGMVLLVAFLLSKDCTYIEGAIHSLDYLLGRNGTGYCFVTGFGSKSPMNPHHRPSTADGVIEPVPGFLVGGPNRSAVVNECPAGEYSQYPAKKWVDLNCSYSTNEVTINWNAPAAFLASGIEAVFNSSEFDVQDLINKYKTDQRPPVPVKIKFTDIKADTAIIEWKTEEKTTVSVLYSKDSSFSECKKIYSPFSDSNQVTLCGLLPDSKYYLRTVIIDKDENTSTKDTSFITSNSDLVSSGLFTHSISSYLLGNDLSITFKNHSGVNTRLIYSLGGSGDQKIINCIENDGEFSVKIPGDDITENGIIYKLFLQKGDDKLTTRQWSVAPESITLKSEKLSAPNTYSLISIPSDFAPVSSKTLLSPVFGDTSSWRFYSYDPLQMTYLSFDTLRSAVGGWFYCKVNGGLTVKGKALKPDSLFPVTLRAGWNCIGNPFPFPIYWNNAFINKDNTFLAITDTLSELFVRHQIFMYKDKTENNKNDGKYRTNRELISHQFDDSIQLETWQAYWIYAEKDSVTLLLNPSPILNRPTLALGKKFYKEECSRWYFSIGARSGDLNDQQVVFGAADEAKDCYDKYDSPKPPSVSSKLQIGFFHPEWNKFKGMYSSDIISNSGNHNWTLNVKIPGTEPVTLSWEKNGSYNGTVYMKDKITGAVIDLTRLNTYTFKPDNNEKNRTLFISWMSDKQGSYHSMPEMWSLIQEKSGSGHSLIKLKYSIPFSSSNESIKTSISVFDINGRCVRKILNESKIPGFYSVTWDGKNNSGRPVVNGLYLVHLNSTAFAKSIRIQLIK